MSDRQQKALNGLATMRDKLVVFNAVRELAFSGDADDEVVLSIREYYEAFDGDQADRAKRRMT